MKYIVTRTSNYGDDEPPCEGAVQEDVCYLDVRTVATPEEFDEKFGKYAQGKWLDKGTDHGITEKGRIYRKLPSKAFTIALADLGELLAFTQKYGEVIIKAPEVDLPDQYFSLEIYDGYRE